MSVNNIGRNILGAKGFKPFGLRMLLTFTTHYSTFTTLLCLCVSKKGSSYIQQRKRQRNIFMSNRITSIDGYRGLLLFLMTFNHLLLLPFIQVDVLHMFVIKYVYNSFGFLSNSEGFFFIAGLTAGIVYGKLILKGKNQELNLKVKKRVFQMYAVHVTLLLGFALFVLFNKNYFLVWKDLHSLVWIWRDAPGIHYFLDNPLTGFALGALFLYTPPFFDILPVYILFLAITPMVLRQLSKGKTILVLGLSFTFWLLSQYTPVDVLENFLGLYIPVKLGWFQPFALQLLFIAGLTIGYAYVNESLIKMSHLFLLVMVLLGILYPVLKFSNADLANAHHLGYMRLSMFAVKAFTAYLLAQWFTLKPFIPLGKYPLPIFGYHILLVYSLTYFLQFFSSQSTPAQILSLSISLSSLWLVAWLWEKRMDLRINPKNIYRSLRQDIT
jgi:hypothetical protein